MSRPRPDKSYKTYRSSRLSRRRRKDDLSLGDERANRGARHAAEDRPMSSGDASGRGLIPSPRGDAAGASADYRRRPVWKTALVVLLVVIVLAVLAFAGWTAYAWVTVDRAVDKANGRINGDTHAALTPDGGSVFSTPTTILVLGVDKRANDPGRSDSIILLRSNPETRTFSQLSIARDMRVEIPGRGMGKINTGFFWGGPALAIKTVEGFTGIPINHVVVISFNGFPKVIDAVGGIDVYVKKTISSWYSGGQTITFKKGWNHMDGKRAMIYSRIRKADNDFFRQARQQQVMQALQKKLTRVTNLPRLPSTTAQIVRGLSTDLTTWELAQLAWRKWRSDTSRRYILTGTGAMIDGQSYVVSNREKNLRMIERFLSQ